MTPVYVVRRIEPIPGVAPGLEMPKPKVTFLSAWLDVYEAKHEAARWEQDTKIEHDYVEGVLILAPHRCLP